MAESFFSYYNRVAPSANELTGRSSKYAQVVGLQKSRQTSSSKTAPSANAPTARVAPSIADSTQSAPATEATTAQTGGRSVKYFKSFTPPKEQIFKPAVMPQMYW